MCFYTVYIEKSRSKMRVLLLFLICHIGLAKKIHVHLCPTKTLNDMKLHVCDDIKDYSKIQFQDVTGENLITVIPDRTYRNHGEYVAFSLNNYLYVAMEHYSDSKWKDSIEYLRNDSEK